MYNKLYTKILDSSIWLEPNPTRIVWITFLAAMNEDGFAQFSSVRNLANRAMVTPEDAETAVQTLESPDPDSNNKANDGRRIERVPGGWMILNAGDYKDIVTRMESLRLNRDRVAKHRAKKAAEKAGNAVGNAPVMQSYSYSYSESESKNSEKRERGADAPAPAAKKEASEQKKPPKASPTRIPTEFWLSPERQEYAELKLPRVDAVALFEEFSDYWRALAGPKALKLDWDATWRTWVRRAADRYPTIRVNGAQAEKIIRYDSKGRPREL